MDIQEIKTYAKYNLWANEKLVKTLQQLTEEQLDQHIVNSFSSIIKTLSHNWLAEYLWLERWKGNSLKEFPYRDYQGSHAERFKEIVKTSRAVADYVNTLTEATLAEIIDISTLAGNSYRHSRYQMIHHCLNHSTYHRGQIVMMCKQLGMNDLGPFDYIWYLREQQLNNG